MKKILPLFVFFVITLAGCKKEDTTAATCTDNIQNQNETAVDCGGVCTACVSCSDGIQNQDETGIDCGGVCSACALPKTTYQLKSKDVLGISGTVTFTETSATVTTIAIELTGVASGTHPAHIHFNSAVEGGGIAISLSPVDATGKSTTTVTALDGGGAINYTQLIAYDGYGNVHESSGNLATIIAQGDIGGNQLTGTSKSYTLNAVNASGVSGTALFEKRKNGNTLVTLSLNGTIGGGTHPSHIHLGSTATIGGGPISATLASVDGATGKSYTNLRSLDNGTPITYDEWLVFDGYLNVHLSMINLGTILSQGNIGSNE